MFFPLISKYYNNPGNNIILVIRLSFIYQQWGVNYNFHIYSNILHVSLIKGRFNELKYLII